MSWDDAYQNSWWCNGAELWLREAGTNWWDEMPGHDSRQEEIVRHAKAIVNLLADTGEPWEIHMRISEYFKRNIGPQPPAMGFYWQDHEDYGGTEWWCNGSDELWSRTGQGKYDWQPSKPPSRWDPFQ